MIQSFRVWLESSDPIKSKVVAQARNIMATALAVANQAARQGKDWAWFETYGIGAGLHQAAIYHRLTARTTGYDPSKGKIGDADNPAVIAQIDQALTAAVTGSQSIQGVVYQKGAGWHHWIVNGDRNRTARDASTKHYLSIDYSSFAANGGAAMPAVLRNLVANGYRGQIKIIADGRSFVSRNDNICLHSDPANLAIGSKVVLAVLSRDGVRSGGSASTHDVTSGRDFGGSSFNDSLATIAHESIVKIVRSCTDYGHFERNIKHHFAENGQFVKTVMANLN